MVIVNEKILKTTFQNASDLFTKRKVLKEFGYRNLIIIIRSFKNHEKLCFGTVF